MFSIVILPILGLLFGFGLIIFLMVKIIPLSLRLLRIRIKEATKYASEYEKNERKAQTNGSKYRPKSTSYTEQEVEEKWRTDGWYYDNTRTKWVSPDYLNTEPKTADELRLRRYHEYRKKQGREPTYEEWKAAREAEKHPD